MGRKPNVCREWFEGPKWDIVEHAKRKDSGMVTGWTVQGESLVKIKPRFNALNWQITVTSRCSQVTFKKIQVGDTGKKICEDAAQSLAGCLVGIAVLRCPVYLSALQHDMQVHSSG